MNGTRAGNSSLIGESPTRYALAPDYIPVYGYQNGMKLEPESLVSDGGKLVQRVTNCSVAY